MSLTPMSPSDFQNTMNNYLDFHRTYLFRVIFFDGAAGALEGAFVTNLISAVDTPVSITGAIALGWQGSKIKLAGKTDYQDWKVTIRDDATSVAYSYFEEWRKKVYNVKTGASKKIANIGLGSILGIGTGYKKSAIVMMLGNKIRSGLGSGSTIAATIITNRAYLISGIWPKDIGAISLDYSTETITTFPVNFSVDYFEPYSLTGTAASLISSIIS